MPQGIGYGTARSRRKKTLGSVEKARAPLSPAKEAEKRRLADRARVEAHFAKLKGDRPLKPASKPARQQTADDFRKAMPHQQVSDKLKNLSRWLKK